MTLNADTFKNTRGLQTDDVAVSATFSRATSLSALYFENDWPGKMLQSICARRGSSVQGG